MTVVSSGGRSDDRLGAEAWAAVRDRVGRWQRPEEHVEDAPRIRKRARRRRLAADHGRGSALAPARGGARGCGIQTAPGSTAALAGREPIERDDQARERDPRRASLAALDPANVRLIDSRHPGRAGAGWPRWHGASRAARHRASAWPIRLDRPGDATCGHRARVALSATHTPALTTRQASGSAFAREHPAGSPDDATVITGRALCSRARAPLDDATVIRNGGGFQRDACDGRSWTPLGVR